MKTARALPLPRASVSVSRAEPEDTAAIRALLVHMDSPFEVERELLREYARLWVARLEPGSGAIAFLLAWDVADEIHLIDLVVSQEQRKRGVGRALVLELLAHARERAARLVLLEVRASNTAAIHLYRAFGFQVAGERARYYTDGEDALEMRLEL